MSRNSPFDRWYYGHDRRPSAFPPNAGSRSFAIQRKGIALFATRWVDLCTIHGQQVHNIGVGVMDEDGDDFGRFKRPSVGGYGIVQTPSLRNVAITAPYFHDGSRQTLKEAMATTLVAAIRIRISIVDARAEFPDPQERADLIAFLDSLTGEIPANSRPPSQ